MNAMNDISKMREALHALAPNKQSKYRDMFTQLLPDIENALHAQKRVKSIWSVLRNQGLDISLATFRKWLAESAQHDTK